MTLHSVFAYIKYRLKARGRHGTHSPFAYRFVEDVLRKNGGLRENMDQFFADLDIKYFSADSAGAWSTTISTNNQVLIFEQIHSSEKHTAAWNKLRERPEVKMSIDLYKYGVLLFLDEFKEKQHFALK